MKKIMIYLTLSILLISLVLAQGPNGPGTGNADGMQRNQNMNQVNAQEENKSDEIQIGNQVREQVKTMVINKKQIQVQQKNKGYAIRAGNVFADSSMEIMQNGTKLQARLSNGNNANVKIMPDTASETALKRLRLKVCSEENNCTIELKEVGKGQEVKAAYEVQTQKRTRVLGLFKTKMQVKAEVDAQTGNVTKVKKPWWAFLTSESED